MGGNLQTVIGCELVIWSDLIRKYKLTQMEVGYVKYQSNVEKART